MKNEKSVSIKQEKKKQKSLQEESIFNKEASLWQETEAKEELSLIEEYEGFSEFSEAFRKKSEELLKQEIKEKKIAFAQKWFDLHEKASRRKGMPTHFSNERKIAIAIEKGALNELKEKEEYKKEREEIENLYALRKDIQKKRIPIESQYLLLNQLNKTIEKENQKMNSADRKDSAEALVEERHLKEWLGMREELANKITGRDIRKEAEEKFSVLPDKEKYISEHIAKIMTKLVKGDKIIDVFRGKENIEKIEAKLRSVFEKRWDKLKEKRAEKIENKVNKEINLLAKSPERAEGGIREEYRKMKERLIKEFIENMKKPRSNEKKKDKFGNILDEIDEFAKKSERLNKQSKEKTKEKKEEEKDALSFIKEILNKKSELSGTLKKDKEKIIGFLNSWDIKTTYEQLEGFDAFMAKKNKHYRYKEVFKKGVGSFFEWILIFAFAVFLLGEQAIKNSKGKK